VRVYLPAIWTTLRCLVDTGEVGPRPIAGFAVTPGLREWYQDDDLEALEYAALVEAGRASLRLLATVPAAPRRRVVLAADVPDELVEVRDDLNRGAVQLAAPVTLGQLASAHVDDGEAEAAVSAAANVVAQTDVDDATAREILDDVEGFELSWYATQEIPSLLQAS
jgi:hypothetical protein